MQRPQHPKSAVRRQDANNERYHSANVVVQPNKAAKIISSEYVDGVNSDLDKITDELMTPKKTDYGENEQKRSRPNSAFKQGAKT